MATVFNYRSGLKNYYICRSFFRNMSDTKSIKNTCFVCQREVTPENSSINKEVYLPVCNFCKETDKEKKAVEEQLDSLADGLVCGCI